MASKALPPPEALRQLLRYEPDTGKLFWLPRPIELFADGAQSARHNALAWNGRYAGKEAMTAVKSDGYRHGALFYRYIPAHRVIWAMETGEWPTDLIDHIDGNKLNNALANLRTANPSQNGFNRGPAVSNTSGIKGVTRTPAGAWLAQMTIMGKAHYVGTFRCRTAAAVAYAKTSRVLHGEFSRVSLS